MRLQNIFLTFDISYIFIKDVRSKILTYINNQFSFNQTKPIFISAVIIHFLNSFFSIILSPQFI